MPKNSNNKLNLALNTEQKAAKERIIKTPFSFVLGAAGSGKTLLACQIALDLFFKKEISKIIITRPTVSTEKNGYLPGGLDEKMEPWLTPIKSNFYKLVRKDIVEKFENDGIIQLMSLSHFRGNTFENSVCIIDEFQNLTKSQIKMAIGRLGLNSIMIFTGDEDQIDLKDDKQSAISVVPLLNNNTNVFVSRLTENHRHPAVKKILQLI